MTAPSSSLASTWTLERDAGRAKLARMSGGTSSEKSLGRLAPLVAPIVPIGLFTWAKTNSTALAVAAVAAMAVGLAGLLWFLRSGATAQVHAAARTGRIDVSAFLDTATLPGTWPRDARRTMGLARNNAPAMPVQLTSDDTAIHLRKTKYGSRPFTADIPLRNIASITVGAATVMPIGSTLHLDLRDGSEARLHLHLSEAAAAELADMLQVRIPTTPSTEPAAGIVITSPAP